MNNVLKVSSGSSIDYAPGRGEAERRFSGD